MIPLVTWGACTEPAPEPPASDASVLPPPLHEELFSGRKTASAHELDEALERWRASRRTDPNISEIRRHRFFLARRARELELARAAGAPENTRPIERGPDLEEVLVGDVEPTQDQILSARTALRSRQDRLLLQFEQVHATQDDARARERLRARFTRGGAAIPTRFFTPDELSPEVLAWAVGAQNGEVSAAFVVNGEVTIYRRIIRPSLDDESEPERARTHAMRKAQAQRRSERLRELDDDTLETPLEDAYLEYRARTRP